MVSRRIAILALLVALPFGLVFACSKVPLLAPTGTDIKILPTANSASLNSTIDIVATVIENGVQSSSGSGQTTTSTTGAGTPVQNGTEISFTTTIGTIEPATAKTVNGQVTVKLVTGATSGTATITAYSGGASASTTLPVGTAAAANLAVSASPTTLGANGGTSTITAQVTDTGGAPIAGVPVTFSTDQGTLSPSAIQSDQFGNAQVLLTTTSTATVTAAAGAKTGTVKVNVGVRPLSTIVANPASGAVGTPITFTVTPTTGANITSVVVNFGDGASTPLGAISAATSTSHAYSAPGQYTVTATATDATGAASSINTNVIIGSLAVTLAASPNPVTLGNSVLFTATVPSGAAVDHYVWVYDDGASDTTSGPQDSHIFPSRGTHTARVDVFGINGGIIGTANAQVAVQ